MVINLIRFDYRNHSVLVRVLRTSHAWPSVDLMLGQHRSRWTSIKIALDQRLVFAEITATSN